MKKSLIPAMLLSLVTLSGLVGCGGKKPSSTSSTAPAPTTSTTPAPAEETTVKELIAKYFNGEKIGEYTTDYTFDLKDEYKTKNPQVTVTGTYVSGAEWSYYETKRSGYIRDDNGDILFIHTAEENTNLQTDIKVGAKIKVTGTLTAYHGYPQINSGWTYELVEKAPETYNTVLSYYTETDPASLFTADKKGMNLDKAKTLVALKNMVLVSAVDQSGLTYFTPLSEVGKADALRIGVYRFHHEDPKAYMAGNVFNIYGAVTSYKGSVQIHATAHSSQDKFTGVQSVAADALTLEQKLVLSDLQANMDSVPSKVTIDYTNGVDKAKDELITVKKSLTIDGMKVFYKVTLPSDAGEAQDDWATIEETPLNRSLKIVKATEAPNPLKNVTGKIQLSRRVCAATDCADADAAFALTDTTKYKEETKTINVVHMFQKLTTLQVAINGSIPEGLSYITNNSKYPNPSWGKDDYAGALKLAYETGGFETDGAFDFTTKVTLKINLAVAAYDKDTSSPAAEGDRHAVLAITAYDAAGNEVYTTESNELYDTANKAFRDETIKIAATANVASVKVLVKTLENSTVYVKSVEITPTPETPAPETPAA
ncbi:MAG TPA: hypothetical protein DCY93_03820 [Firmicutes bacterium]|nr:hypothetical protein [Bacillota bacterium]